MNMAHLRGSDTRQPNSDFSASVCCLVYFCKIVIVKTELYMLAKLQLCNTDDYAATFLGIELM